MGMGLNPPRPRTVTCRPAPPHFPQHALLLLCCGQRGQAGCLSCHSRVQEDKLGLLSLPLTPSCSQHLLRPGSLGISGVGLVPLLPMASGARKGIWGSVLPPELGGSRGGLCFPHPPPQTLTNTHRERKL